MWKVLSKYCLLSTIWFIIWLFIMNRRQVCDKTRFIGIIDWSQYRRRGVHGAPLPNEVNVALAWQLSGLPYWAVHVKFSVWPRVTLSQNGTFSYSLVFTNFLHWIHESLTVIKCSWLRSIIIWQVALTVGVPNNGHDNVTIFPNENVVV